MRVSLSIDCDGDAFYVADPAYELVRILRKLADVVEQTPNAENLGGTRIADANGNTVGTVRVQLTDSDYAECPHCGRECEPGDAECRDSDCARHDAPPATVAVHLPRDLAEHLTRNAVLSVAYDDVIAYAMECRDAADRASWIADADALKHLHDHIHNAMQEGNAL